jgi:DNA-directed RNA polymerase subunit RPC12/RpoP
MTIRNDIEKLKFMFDALDIAQPALKKEKPQDDEVATDVGLDAVDFNKKPEPNHGLDTVKDKELEQIVDIVSPLALYVCNDCAKVAEGENLKCSQCDSLDIEVITEYEGEKGPLPKRTPEEILQAEEDEEINLRDDALRDEKLARRSRKESRELSVPEKHQLKIAKKTLQMSDAGANIMGGMDKKEARAFLKKIGYSDDKIAGLEEALLEFGDDPKYKSVARGMDKEEAEKYAKQNGGQVTVDDAEDNKDEFNPKFMVVKKENEDFEHGRPDKELDNTGYGDHAVACPECKEFNDPDEGEANPNKRQYTCSECGKKYTYGNWSPQREAKVYEQLAAYRKARDEEKE